MLMLDQVSENLLIILRLISLEVILYTVHVLYISMNYCLPIDIIKS